MLSMGEMEEQPYAADEFDLRDKWGRQKSDKRFQGHKFLGISDVPAATTERLESMHPVQRTTIW